jgi:hypothetical protein
MEFHNLKIIDPNSPDKNNLDPGREITIYAFKDQERPFLQSTDKTSWQLPRPTLMNKQELIVNNTSIKPTVKRKRFEIISMHDQEEIDQYKENYIQTDTSGSNYNSEDSPVVESTKKIMFTINKNQPRSEQSLIGRRQNIVNEEKNNDEDGDYSNKKGGSGKRLTN